MSTAVNKLTIVCMKSRNRLENKGEGKLTPTPPPSLIVIKYFHASRGPLQNATGLIVLSRMRPPWVRKQRLLKIIFEKTQL